MPNYDYTCSSCSQNFEIFQSMKDEPLAECPHCKAKSPDFKRLIGSGAGIVFKGSGFYETDYKGSSSKVSKGPNPSEGSQSGSCEKKSGCCSK